MINPMSGEETYALVIGAEWIDLPPEANVEVRKCGDGKIFHAFGDAQSIVHECQFLAVLVDAPSDVMGASWVRRLDGKLGALRHRITRQDLDRQGRLVSRTTNMIVQPAEELHISARLVNGTFTAFGWGRL